MSIKNLSVLDLVPVRHNQTSSDAIAATIALAKEADRLNYRRYWIAEHHNMPAIAATNPAIFIALIAQQTTKIRVGSGGVMLPNHAPLTVAEQFAVLTAAFGDRIDLGIGRAPGSDPVTNWALRSGGAAESEEIINRFPQYVENVLAWLSPEGADLNVGGRLFNLRATPRAEGLPQPWLLGSSDYSARLAGQLGLPYVFAHHFSGHGTAEALALYRSSFSPSEFASKPTTFLTVNAVTGDSEKDALRQAMPYFLQMLAIRSGQPLTPMHTVESAGAVQLPQSQLAQVDQFTGPWLLGTPEQVLDQINDLATSFGVDEVMIQPVAGATDADSAQRNSGRERTLAELAQYAGLTDQLGQAGTT